MPLVSLKQSRLRGGGVDLADRAHQGSEVQEGPSDLGCPRSVRAGLGGARPARGRGGKSAQPRSRWRTPGASGRVLRFRSHGARRSGARLVSSGAVAAAVQLGVPRECRAAGPAGQDR